MTLMPFWHKAHSGSKAAEHDRLYGRLPVLEGEIKVTCAHMMRKARYLALYKETSQLDVLLELESHISVKL